MKPGPKVPGRLAKTGEYCPPGSEGTRVYSGKRPFRRVCKYGGHPKFHPGRCVECRRLSDKARDMKPGRADEKLDAWRRWKAKPESIEHVAAYASKYNAREEVKAANAKRQRMYRRGEKVTKQTNPAEVAAKLMAKAEAKAKQAKYGIQQIGNYNP